MIMAFTPLYVCDNSDTYPSSIIQPSCHMKAAKRDVVISYNDIEEDECRLCEGCYQNLRRAARQSGAKIKSKRIGDIW